MDFFCINLVFTLLKDWKWVCFKKKKSCLWINIKSDNCTVFCFLVISWWRLEQLTIQSTPLILYTKVLYTCHNVSYTDANPEIWYWVLFAFACHFLHTGINLYFSKHLKLQKLYHDKCRLVIVDEWFSDNHTIFLSDDG